MITACLVCDRAKFGRDGLISAARTEVCPDEWIELFLETNVIYRSGLLAIVLTTSDPTIDLDSKSIAFYIDNNSAHALIKANCDRIAVSVLARLLEELVDRRGIAPWLGRVPPGRNIADLPTRNVDLPYYIRDGGIFPFQTPFADGEGSYPT